MIPIYQDDGGDTQYKGEGKKTAVPSLKVTLMGPSTSILVHQVWNDRDDSMITPRTLDILKLQPCNFH